MNVLRTIDDMRAWRSASDASVGLVPTMGYLHEGHLSLVRAARRDNERAVVTIFVNRAQFGPTEDFERYPRDEARDLGLLDREGVDAVFAPSAEEMYPDGYATYVAVGGIADRLEGACRPGHFRAVTTVVLKLLNIVQPAHAYFGQKDAQQFAVVRKMVADLDVRVDVVDMPIVREPDGLAMSSRNAYLSGDERRAARVLSRAVHLAQELFALGARDAVVIRGRMESLIASEPLVAADYVSIADASTLEEVRRIDAPVLVSLAVRVGRTRLIDNTTLLP